jgi:hypothetical protein
VPPPLVTNLGIGLGMWFPSPTRRPKFPSTPRRALDGFWTGGALLRKRTRRRGKGPRQDNTYGNYVALCLHLLRTWNEHGRFQFPNQTQSRGKNRLLQAAPALFLNLHQSTHSRTQPVSRLPSPPSPVSPVSRTVSREPWSWLSPSSPPAPEPFSPPPAFFLLFFLFFLFHASLPPPPPYPSLPHHSLITRTQ